MRRLAVILPLAALVAAGLTAVPAQAVPLPTSGVTAYSVDTGALPGAGWGTRFALPSSAAGASGSSIGGGAFSVGGTSGGTFARVFVGPPTGTSLAVGTYDINEVRDGHRGTGPDRRRHPRRVLRGLRHPDRPRGHPRRRRGHRVRGLGARQLRRGRARLRPGDPLELHGPLHPPHRSGEHLDGVDHRHRRRPLHHDLRPGHRQRDRRQGPARHRHVQRQDGHRRRHVLHRPRRDPRLLRSGAGPHHPPRRWSGSQDPRHRRRVRHRGRRLHAADPRPAARHPQARERRRPSGRRQVHRPGRGRPEGRALLRRHRRRPQRHRRRPDEPGLRHRLPDGHEQAHRVVGQLQQGLDRRQPAHGQARHRRQGPHPQRLGLHPRRRRRRRVLPRVHEHEDDRLRRLLGHRARAHRRHPPRLRPPQAGLVPHDRLRLRRRTTRTSPPSP